MEKQNVNPALLRAVEDASYAIYVIIGCIADEDSRKVISDSWKSALEEISKYMSNQK